MAEILEDYMSVLSDLIKKQMVILGPGVALTTARKVAGLTITDDGTVEKIDGEPQSSVTQLAQAYMNLSGQIAQNTLNSILERYPDIKENISKTNG